MPSPRPIAVAAAILLAAATTAAAQSRSADKKDESSRTSAPQAILIEAEGGSILFERDADRLVYPASLAKLMTAEYVFNEIKQGRLKLDDEFTVSEDAWRRGGAPSRTSSMFAPIHSKVRVEDLLRGVIIQSGNDASIALAEGIAGNERTFAERMTKRARDIGLTKSTFMNATGLPDPDQQVTVR